VCSSLNARDQVSYPCRTSGTIIVSYISIYPVWWQGLKNSPTVTHACHKKRLKWIPSAWGYCWATLSLEVINTETWSSRLGVGS
jgi:hypothetical protein